MKTNANLLKIATLIELLDFMICALRRCILIHA
jgi:hypothetical protein